MRYGKYFHLNQPRLKVGHYLFLPHGGKIVFFGRFTDLEPHELASFLVNAFGGLCWASTFGTGARVKAPQFMRGNDATPNALRERGS